MSGNTWALIHTERQNLIIDMENLTADQWNTPSLCDSWNVHQMLGHVVALTKQTPPKFFGKFAAAGFKFDRFAARDVARESSGTPEQTLAEFITHVEDTTAPPGPLDSWIGEIVVHSADIRRPLGIAYTPPATTSRRVADFYKNSNLLIGAKNRIRRHSSGRHRYRLGARVGPGGAGPDTFADPGNDGPRCRTAGSRR